jgi:hypothetical protein
MAMRPSGILTVLASLLFCPTLRAESPKPSALADKGPSTTSVPVAAKPASKPASNVATSGGDESGCTLTGTAMPELDLQLVDDDGRPVARFGGVAVRLTVSGLPGRADGKVRVTTAGNGRLRIAGFVAVHSLPIYLKQDLAIVKGHVTLLKGTAVEYLGRAGDQIRIGVKTHNAIAETYNATVACDALTVEAQQPNKWEPPGQARGYLMKQSVAPLFDQPGAEAEPVSSIHLASDARGVLFYGDRREGEFIHVSYRRDVGIDGWMAVKDLEILPRGEVVDQSVSKYAPHADKKLKMKVEGQLYKAQSEIPLYGKADPKLPPIGAVTEDTELYVLDVMVGWANVLPKQLDVVPLSEKHFWVKASEL